MIVGLVQPNDGKVFFDGKEVTQRAHVQARPPRHGLPAAGGVHLPPADVRENIMAVMETQPYTKQEREEQTQPLMEKFGIDHVADNLAITLSGGEKRRLTIARSLVTEPKLLMLDEPFSGVDPIAVSEIQEIIRMLRSAGLAILITDHNVRETLNIVDRAYLIFRRPRCAATAAKTSWSTMTKPAASTSAKTSPCDYFHYQPNKQENHHAKTQRQPPHHRHRTSHGRHRGDP